MEASGGGSGGGRGGDGGGVVRPAGAGSHGGRPWYTHLNLSVNSAVCVFYHKPHTASSASK